MQDLLVLVNLSDPVPVKMVKEIEAAERAQAKGQTQNAQEQEDDAVSRWKTVSTETDKTGIDDEPLFENPKDEP